MKCSFGISRFHEELSSFSHFNFFLYFFELITEEGFLISPCCFFGTLLSNGFLFAFLLLLLFPGLSLFIYFPFIFISWRLITLQYCSSFYHTLTWISHGFTFFFSLIFFFQLFVRPPQIIILPFCISFSWGWSWSLPPVQCHEPSFLVLQAVYQI